jgi:YidC/Oxa1 family membrane protein insertase
MYDLTVSMGVPNYGLAIILFTAAIRLLMFPLNLQQAKSTKAMSLLQPKMKQLQQQYKNSPEILNREVSALYKKYNVNPLAGCLPLLVQMPILIALLSALRGYEYTGAGVSFFWLPNLSEPDATIILPIIVGLSSFLQSKITMAMQPTQSGDQAKMMNNVMLYVMPVMLGWMSRTFASGVAIYWTVFNVLGFLMQMAINTIINRSHADMRAAMEADEAKEAAAQAAIQAEKAAQRERQKEAAKRKAAERRQEADNRIKPKKKSSESNKGKPLNFDDD